MAYLYGTGFAHGQDVTQFEWSPAPVRLWSVYKFPFVTSTRYGYQYPDTRMIFIHPDRYPTDPTWTPPVPVAWRWLVRIPMWLIVFLAALSTAILWWRDHRAVRPGHCRTCGYNLTGNATGRCPECFTPLSVPKRV